MKIPSRVALSWPAVLSALALGNVNAQSIRLRLAAEFLLAVIALFGGLLILALLLPADPAPLLDPTLLALQSAPLPWLLVVATFAPVIEAFVFSFLFIEGAARTRLGIHVGALIGAFVYSVPYHWSKGLSGIIVSGWLIIVINSMYLAMRAHSARIAFAGVVMLRWLYVTVAILLARVFV